MFGFTDNQMGAISCIMVALLVTSMFLSIGGKRTKYKKPVASYKSDGVIKVEGDVDYLQRNFHQVASASNWVHTGQYKWEIHLPHACSKSDQQHIIDAINRME